MPHDMSTPRTPMKMKVNGFSNTERVKTEVGNDGIDTARDKNQQALSGNSKEKTKQRAKLQKRTHSPVGVKEVQMHGHSPNDDLNSDKNIRKRSRSSSSTSPRAKSIKLDDDSAGVELLGEVKHVSGKDSGSAVPKTKGNGSGKDSKNKVKVQKEIEDQEVVIIEDGDCDAVLDDDGQVKNKNEMSRYVYDIPYHASERHLTKSFSEFGVSRIVRINPECARVFISGKVKFPRLVNVNRRMVRVSVKSPYFAYVTNVPDHVSDELVESRIKGVWPRVYKMKRFSYFDGTQASFVQIFTHSQADLEEILQRSHIKLWKTALQIYTEEQFYQRHSLRILGLPFGDEPRKYIEIKLHKHLKKCDIKDKCVIKLIMNQIAQLIFSSEDAAKSALCLDGQVFSGNRQLSVHAWSDTPYYVTIHNINPRARRKDVESLLHNVNVKLLYYTEGSMQCLLEVRSPDDQQICLKLHQKIFQDFPLIVLIEEGTYSARFGNFLVTKYTLHKWKAFQEAIKRKEKSEKRKQKKIKRGQRKSHYEVKEERVSNGCPPYPSY